MNESSGEGVRHVAVAPGDADQRLDRWFKRRFPELGYGRLARLLRTGQVRVDGRRAKPGQRLEAGQEIRIPPLGDVPGPRPHWPGAMPVGAADAEALRARVLHRDGRMLVLDKPAGLAVQGGSKTTRHLDAMLDALRFDAGERPRLVHRLDKDTSGVLLLARDAVAARELTRLFSGRDVEKVYWALVAGIPSHAEGRIDLALEKRGGRGREKVRGGEAGQRAITDYALVERAGNRAAWLELMPRTGRTHQLRAHCAAMGTPILGDGKYGGRAAFLPGVAKRVHLHARALAFRDPFSGRPVRFEAPLDAELAASWAHFGFAAEARQS